MRGNTKFGGAQRTLSRMVKKHYKTVTKQVSNYWKRKMPKSIEASVRKQYGNLPKAQLDVKIKNSQIKFLRDYGKKLDSTVKKYGNRSRLLDKKLKTSPTPVLRRRANAVRSYTTHLEDELFSLNNELQRLQTGKTDLYTVPFMRQWQ